jgi:hypothetical protein
MCSNTVEKRNHSESDEVSLRSHHYLWTRCIDINYINRSMTAWSIMCTILFRSGVVTGASPSLLCRSLSVHSSSSVRLSFSYRHPTYVNEWHVIFRLSPLVVRKEYGFPADVAHARTPLSLVSSMSLVETRWCPFSLSLALSLCPSLSVSALSLVSPRVS